jgi:SagB-type dehydrogenase family enzyme
MYGGKVMNGKILIEKEDEIYYWSSSINWRLVDGKLKIERFIYSGDIVHLFPEFYFMAQDGVELNKIADSFPEINKMKINVFIKDLIKKKILINSILTPNQVFYPQKRLVKHSYSENLMYDPNEIHEYKTVQLNRKYKYESEVTIKLSQAEEFTEIISKRKSYRDFNKNVMPFEKFSNLISIFKQMRDGEDIRYYYASAGGLYPIDIYMYVKENRVENIARGLYYYSPVNNNLSLISDEEISDEAHYYSNKDIFNSSAISIFFIYNAQSNIPKYGGNGYLYACIDTGIMVSTFTTAAQTLGIGLCSIGDMSFRNIEKRFKLSKDQVFIHELECGMKNS